jgi:hypothetical protein
MNTYEIRYYASNIPVCATREAQSPRQALHFAVQDRAIPSKAWNAFGTSRLTITPKSIRQMEMFK